MKKLLLLVLSCIMAITSASAAKKTFTAVASNVDGLPPVVHINALGIVKKDINMNPDGSQEKGATRMGELFQERLWDLVGLSEDFNYHSYITSACNTYYNSTTYRGKIEQENLDGAITGYLSQSVHMNTDGLNLLYRNKYKVLSETIVKWKDHHGYDDHEADGLINKGFRKYEVTFGDKLNVDVYILHMDAGSCDAIGDCEEGDDDKCKNGGDIGARTKQMQQLVAYIKASDTKNPIIIIGDTNCRYTRDSVKEDLIDAINADDRFDIHDPWLEQDYWKNKGGFKAPEIQRGQPSIMVHDSRYGEQLGEVVDKVFYINNTNSDCKLSFESYYHDDQFTYADGSQIADHFPVVATLSIENSYEPPVNTFVIPDAPEKKAVVNGQGYYIRNLATGEFIRAGWGYGTKAILDTRGDLITIDGSGNSFALKTPSWGNYLGNDGSDYWMDNLADNKTKWTFTQVDKNIYRLTDNKGKAMAAGNGMPVPAVANANDKNQQWEFLTKDDLVNELYYALSDEPKDATFYMPGPALQEPDNDKGLWSTKSDTRYGYVKFTYPRDGNFACLKAAVTSTNADGTRKNWTIERTVSGLPAGTYKVSYQSVLYTTNHTFEINGVTAPVNYVYSGTPDDGTILSEMRNGSHSHEVTVVVKNDGDYPNQIKIYINKTHTGSKVTAYYGNFKITCIGLEGKVDNRLYDRVQAAIDDVYLKAGQAGTVVDLRALQSRVDDRDITGDGWTEVKQAYQKLAEATLKNTAIPADYTNVILNPSFELYPDYKDARYNIGGGYPFGWNYPATFSYDSGVWPASDTNKKTVNAHGEYIYNTWNNGVGGYALVQELGIPTGIYELSAMVATENGRNVYLFAGDGGAIAKAMVAGKGNATLVPVKIRFFHEGGQNIPVGVVGANGTALDFSANSSWYKADDFRLTRIGGAETIEGMRLVQAAINAVKAKDSSIDLSAYQAMLDNYQLTGNGVKEFNEVYGKLREKVFAKTGNNVDMTDAIANNSFEWFLTPNKWGNRSDGRGDLWGWDTEILNDTQAADNGNSTYTTKGAVGSRVFNTWDNGEARKVTQTIYGVPKGRYELKALVAGDDGNTYFLAVNENQISSVITTTGKETFVSGSLKFDVPGNDSEITIGVYPAGNGTTFVPDGHQWWYKADYFTLTKIDENVDMTPYYNRLQKVIDWTTARVKELPAPYSEDWDLSSYQALITNKTLDGDGSKEEAEIYALMRERVFAQTEKGADMTIGITNASFELGDFTGWTTKAPLRSWSDIGVYPNTNGTYTCNNTHGDYLANIYGGEDRNDEYSRPIAQTITGLRPGVYKVSAYVTTWNDRKAYMFANGILSEGKQGTVPDPGEEYFSEFADASVEVIVRDGILTIGAVAHKNGVPVIPVALADEILNDTNANGEAWNGCFFKADNFRLTYLYSLSYLLLQHAIDDATEKAKEAGVTVDLSKWQQMVDNHTVSDDGKQEILDVYQALAKAVLDSANEDKTYAVVNNSFELEKWGLGYLGWEVLSDGDDIGVKPAENSIYKMSGSHGDYLFNAYNDRNGTIISQTIKGVPAGQYELTVTAANWAKDYIYIEVKGDATLAGQKSDPIQLEGTQGVGEDVSFIFNVADGTPEITIYIGGCYRDENGDASYDDFGGQFFKIDNVRLNRIGDPDICFFYKRLKNAIDDANDVVAETLDEPYQNEWVRHIEPYKDIIRKHLSDGHNPDKGETGSEDPLADNDEYSNNGIEEVKAIYNMLRDFVYSQNRNEANMTGAISNHSFEMEDLTGWTCYAEPNSDTKVTRGNNGDIYATSGLDEDFIFNTYIEGEGGKKMGYPIYQTLPNMPKGKYRLEVKLASDKGNQFYIAANDKHSDVITTSGASTFEQFEFVFEVTDEMKDVTIGVYPAVNGKFDRSDVPENMGAWFKADDFRLYLVSRQLTIEWTMETPTHGTIILPFAVSEKSLKDKGLSVYTIVSTAESDTPADDDVNTYHIITYKDEKSIKPNTPYVVMNDKVLQAVAAPGKTVKKATAGLNEGSMLYSGETYYFTNSTTDSDYNLENEFDNNVSDVEGKLVGTLVDHVVSGEEYHLNTDGTNVGFIHHETANELDSYETNEIIPAYHAYMINPVQAIQASDEDRIATEFFFDEPVLPIEWTMEGELYGTLILPFDAEIPDTFEKNTLGVYPVLGLSDEKVHETGKFKYQILETGDEVDVISANVPYIVMHKDMKSAAPRKAPNKAPADAYEGLTQTFSGAATNKEASYGDEYTGVLTTTDIDDAARTLKSDGSFVAGDSEQVGAYHAYLPTAQSNYVYVTGPNEDQVSGIEDLIAADGEVDVYDLNGVLLRTEVPVSEALEGLGEGIYILRSGELSVKVLK